MMACGVSGCRIVHPAVVNGLMKRDMRRSVSMNNSQSFDSVNHKSICPIKKECDFILDAKKKKKKFLIDGKQERVPVESLRGKVLMLYFESNSRVGVPDHHIDSYNTLKRIKPDAAFEMIYVVPPKYDQSRFDALVASATTALASCLAVPFEDLDWRSYLFSLYQERVPCSSDIVVIDTRDNKDLTVTYRDTCSYGPLLYPFTAERIQQLEAECEQLGRETSISAILGDDYLLDPHSNKVPISSLENKHVLIYGVLNHDPIETNFEIQLGEIYHKFNVEIVSVNLEYNRGDGGYETLWEDHLAQIPWLHLPVVVGDGKIWLLRTMMFGEYSPDPILFVKPKGKSLLDPYGYQVIDMYGSKAFPFTRKAAARYVLTRLKGLSFKSFVDEASHLGLDFNHLIRNKVDGETELVSLSNLMLQGRRRRRRGGILLLFGNSWNFSGEVLDSLINVYLNQNESSSSFEVIFVSTTRYFLDHFWIMPWFAFHRPLEQSECIELNRRTTHVEFGYDDHFLAFGPDLLLAQVGNMSRSFENRVFPFVNDDESTDYLVRLTTNICPYS